MSECFLGSFADDKVCVVGLFGNGRSGAQAKAFYANSAVERNVFQVNLTLNKQVYCFLNEQYEWVDEVMRKCR